MVLLRWMLVTFMFALSVIHCQDAETTPASEESTTVGPVSVVTCPDDEPAIPKSATFNRISEATTLSTAGGDSQTTASTQSEVTTAASSSDSTTLASSTNDTGSQQPSKPTGQSSGCRIVCEEVPDSGSDGSNQPSSGATNQPAVVILQGVRPFGRPFGGPGFHPGFFRPYGFGPFGPHRRPYGGMRRRFRGPNRFFGGYRRPIFFDEADGANDEVMADDTDDVADEMADSSQTGYGDDQPVPEGRMMTGNNEKLYMCKKVCS